MMVAQLPVSQPRDVKSPFFIVGSGRSGTTLVRALLNATGDVLIPHESDFVARGYPYFFHKSGHYTSDDRRLLARMFISCSQNRGWGLSEARLSAVISSPSVHSFADVHRAICEEVLREEGCAHLNWGIKAPNLVLSLPRVRRVFPDARFIHVVRDGRDVFLSYRAVHRQENKPFGPKGVLPAALYWVDGLREFERFSRTLPSESYLEVRFEDLLDKPDRVVRRICDFLGIRYKNDLIESYARASGTPGLLLASHKDGIHRKVLGGIDRGNKEKYLRLMPAKERRLFECVARPYLLKYNYSLTEASVTGMLWRMVRLCLFTLGHTFNLLRYRLREMRLFCRARHAES